MADLEQHEIERLEQKRERALDCVYAGAGVLALDAAVGLAGAHPPSLFSVSLAILGGLSLGSGIRGVSEVSEQHDALLRESARNDKDLKNLAPSKPPAWPWKVEDYGIFDDSVASPELEVPAERQPLKKPWHWEFDLTHVDEDGYYEDEEVDAHPLDIFEAQRFIMAADQADQSLGHAA